MSEDLPANDVALTVGQDREHAPLFKRAVLVLKERGHPARQQPLGVAELVGQLLSGTRARLTEVVMLVAHSFRGRA